MFKISAFSPFFKAKTKIPTKDVTFMQFKDYKIEGEYSKHIDLLSMKDVYRRIRKHFATGRSLIDIGGQTGKDKQRFNGFEYHVMDLIERPTDANTDLVIGDICNCPHLSSNAYDVVFSKDVLEHVEDPFAATREMVRLCKPGGLIVCITPFAWRFHESPKDYWRFTHQALELLFNKAGGQLERTGYDATRRRKNQIGGKSKNGKWIPNETTPPIDQLGGWRENWHAIYIGRKPAG